MLQRIHTLIGLILLPAALWAQQPRDSLTNFRVLTILPASDTIVLDTLMIVPQSVAVSGSNIPFRVDVASGVIRFEEVPADTIKISYRVFPFRPRTMEERFDFDSIRFNFTAENPYTYRSDPSAGRLVDFGNMDFNGSFGRGISFGNNQDAVVNSSLNLQIHGFIGDSLELTAAISDNNIPIQPDGNTQNIQDFDRIFMQVKKHGWQLSFGDIDIRQGDQRYLNFYKRLQGASFISENKFNNGNKNHFITSAAVAKGKFTRNVIVPQEGNQGPYKLYGGNNEIYFAVLAGTERIFIDGVLMQRGEDRDYVIDYNLAELTFTANRLITKDSRIQAEFEYSDRNFLNSMLYAKNEFSIKERWKFMVGAWSNADARNSPINQPLSTEQKYFLSTIGNNIEDALYPGAVADTFAAGKILYEKVDTTVNGVTDTIYVFSTDQNVQLYNLSFTNVGAGKGHYVASQGTANGRVFEWVAPVDGKPQGEWEPAIFLVAPKKHQVFSGSAEYLLNANTQVKVSGALSDYDPNTFSSIGNDENKGAAFRVDLDNQRWLSAEKKNMQLRTHIDYEFVDRRFRAIERLRGVEFYRDWGLPLIIEPANEKLFNLQLGLAAKQNNFVRYGFSSYQRDASFAGVRNSVEGLFETAGWRFDSKIFLTQANSDFMKLDFIRPSIAVSKVLKSLSNYRAGASFSSETNRQLLRVYDTLSPESFSFDIWEIFLKSDETRPSRWGISYYFRENRLPMGRQLKTSDRSNNFSVMSELLGHDDRQLRFNLTYRQLFTDSLFGKTRTTDESLLGRADYTFNEFNGVLGGAIFYELGAGQEQKRQFTYVEVPAGQGYYMWVDYNNDGIPQLDEFEIAIFQDQKRWVRILTTTNEYIKANYVQFNYNLTFNPQRLSTGTSDLKFLKRFNTVSALQINKKEISDGRFLFNPFTGTVSDSSLVSLHSFFSNSVYFNRASPVWGADLTHRVNTNKAILSYGFESSRMRDLALKLRYNLSRTINASLRSNLKKRRLSVPAFDNRNYEVDEFHLEPSLSYTYKTDFRATILYGYEQKENLLGQKERSDNHSLAAEVRYNVFSSGVLSGKLKLNSISYEGNVNSPVGFILLDGLLPGKNLLWNLELTKRLAGNIEMNLQYEGRKPSSTRVIHTGRASLRAIF